ncbi:act minimal PKS acyl carrier protein [Thermomonospora echinospora]|uniref:Act minimal PKS acyl carrier protein n=1 Tax=Thermomonospora echinospora TaxID=1992 RepID=A0A1H5VE77_9ACTN|nr:acyl carrier protein [Thermomonospora echinospora]SEF85553.1 act minimal PKS acyl carrier protein [Thermomonospora echinospora]
MGDHEELTLPDLRRILREAAGVNEGTDLDGEILDLDFEDLGYDSLALLETGARIEREYGVRLEDDAITSARTPRALLTVVNLTFTDIDAA